MTALTVAPARVGRTVAKAAAGVALLAAACAGVYAGAGALARHYSQPDTSVSYATPDKVAATLQGAWHTPARAGDFREHASIQTPDVVSVVQVMAP